MQKMRGNQGAQDVTQRKLWETDQVGEPLPSPRLWGIAQQAVTIK